MTRLEELPARIDDLTLQISQLRQEMRGEFSAVRAEMAEQGASLGARIDEQGVTLATQMRVLHEDLIGRIALLREGPNGAAKRGPTLSRRSGSPSVPRRRRKK